MADEIADQNHVRVTFAGDRWRAAIGPDDDLGLCVESARPDDALFLLAARVMTDGWLFDPSWRPRRVPGARESFLSRVRRWLTKRRKRRAATPAR